MAETLTMESNVEKTSIDSLSAEEQDSLKVGEQMQEAQDNLLAGKYKSAQELEQGYLELQKKLGESEQGTETTTDETESEYEYYSDDGNVNYETANELYGDQLGSLFKSNNIDPFEMSKHFEDNGGTLSDEMYDQLGKAGLSKNVIDNYLDGVRNQIGYNPDKPEPALSESDVNELKGLAGGEEGYKNLMEWAGNNLGEDAAKDYDAVLATGNKSAVKFAITALLGKYEDSMGRDSKIVTGKESSTENYRSMAEVVRDMNKPEYQNDEAFRDDVLRKLSASNLKV